jgi:SAM-dependent methyltransferase
MIDRREEWEAIYREPAETLPWHLEELDHDLEAEIKELPGKTFLDLGTGTGTQARKLAELGFIVTATDISKAAISQAKDSKVRFIHDDIIETNIDERFDYVFDRGLFHTLYAWDRSIYVANVHRIVKDKFFLKVFSKRETADFESKFSPADIRSLFGRHFIIEKIRETAFSKGEKALFVVMRPFYLV